MKFPQKPPNWHDLFYKSIAEGHAHQIDALDRKFAQESEKYFHWDEFRHRTAATKDLSVQQQWAVLKSSRSSRYQLLPFSDEKGEPFKFFLTQFAFKKVHEIDLHCGGGIDLPKEVTHQDTKDRYYITSLIEESLTSSQLEGAVVTRAEANEMIRTKRRPMNDHEKMVLNNFRTMVQMEDWHKKKLTPELILEIHRSITTGTLEDPSHVGAFRDSDDISLIDEETNEVFHRPPPHPTIGKSIQDLCDFANDGEMKGFLHPVIRAIVLHFWLAYLHPFHDGNGRTARALFYWSMLKQGFWLFEFISVSHEILKAPKKYYRAFLHTETDEGDLNYFIHHQLSIIDKAIISLKTYIERKRTELSSLYQQLKPGTNYNHRQLALIKNALQHPHARYTFASHEISHGISNQTARTDLQQLEKEGLLISARNGRAIHFVPVKNFQEQLSYGGDENEETQAVFLKDLDRESAPES